MKNLIYLVVILFLFLNIFLHSEGSWKINEQFLEQTKKVASIIFVKYSEDGNSIFTFSTDTILRSWNAASGNLIYEKKIPFVDFMGTSFSDISGDGKYILISRYTKKSAYDDNAEIIKYDLLLDSVLFILKHPFVDLLGGKSSGPPEYVFGASITAKFSHYDTKIISRLRAELEYCSLASDGSMYLWDSQTGKKINIIGKGNIVSAEFSPDTINFAYSYYIRNNDMYQTSSYGVVINKKRVDSVVYSLIFTNDNKKVVGIGQENELRFMSVWDVNNDYQNFKENINDYREISKHFMAKDDRYLIYCTKNVIGIVKFPEFALAEINSFPDTNSSRIFCIHPANNYIAYGAGDGILRIFKSNMFNKELQAIFKTDPTIYFVGDSVRFYDYSYGESINWLWDFGDGGSSIEQNPFHIYNDTGTYTVTLIVASATEKDTMIRYQYIRINENPVIAVEEIISSKFNTNFIFPNPFSSSTKFRFNLVQPALVNLTIYNSLGQEIAVLCDEWKNTGEYEINFNGSNLNSGVYYYKFSVGSENHFGKVVLIR